jgi:hypothetical protein
MRSVMQMWFCGWCLLDTRIANLIINSFAQGQWVPALPHKQTNLEPVDWQQPRENTKAKFLGYQVRGRNFHNVLLTKVNTCEGSKTSIPANLWDLG